jgi:hypothetical protein
VLRKMPDLLFRVGGGGSSATGSGLGATPNKVENRGGWSLLPDHSSSSSDSGSAFVGSRFFRSISESVASAGGVGGSARPSSTSKSCMLSLTSFSKSCFLKDFLSAAFFPKAMVVKIGLLVGRG